MSDQAQLKANKRLAREYIQRVFNEHCPDLSTEYVTDDVVWHGGILGDIAGAGNVGGLLSAFIGALPDLYAAEQDVVAENDLVMVRLVVKATQKGDLLGVPPAAPRSSGTPSISTASATAASAKSGPRTTSPRS